MTATAAKTRTKAPAAPPAIVNRQQLLGALNELASVRARIAEAEALADEAVAAIETRRAFDVAPLNALAEGLFAEIQAYAEANREALTESGAKKVPVGPHAIAWRQRPPRVELTSDESLVLDELRKLGLQKFIAVKEKIDKRAMLAEPKAAIGVAGVDIRVGEEEFIVETVL